MNIDSITESPETGHSRYIAERPGFHLLHAAKARFKASSQRSVLKTLQRQGGYPTAGHEIPVAMRL